MPTLPIDIVSRVTDPQPQDLLAALAAFPDWVRTRGLQYADEGRVGAIRQEGASLRAPVRGGHVYATRWTFGPTSARSICSCPAGPQCKHAFAMGALVLAALVQSGRVPREEVAGVLDPAWFGDAPTKRGGGRTWVPTGADRSDLRLKAELRRLGSHEHWEAASAASFLLLESGVWSDAVPRSAVDDVLREPDADLRALRLARLIVEARGQAPALLTGYLQREDLAQRLAERERAQLLDSLQRWPAREATPKRLRAVLGLIGVGAQVEVTLEARLTTDRMDDASRSTHQLEALASELKRDASVLTPPQARLLRALLEGELRYTLAGNGAARLRVSELEHLLDRVGDSPFVTWDTALPGDLAERAGITPGARVRVSAESARLEPGCTPDGDDLVLGLRAVLADGTARPLEHVLHLPATAGEQPWSHGFVVAHGLVHRVSEEPPLEVMRHFRETGSVRVGASESSVLQSLAMRFSAVADALRMHAVMHAVTPVVCLDLRESDWLQVRVFAHEGAAEWRPGLPLAADETLFEWQADGRWARVREVRADAQALLPEGTAEAPSEAPDEDDDLEGLEPTAPPAAPPVPTVPEAAPSTTWLHLPEPARVAPVETWLATLGLRTARAAAPGQVAPMEPDRDLGRWLKLTRRSIEACMRAWDDRPRGVRFYGNRQSEQLFGSGSRPAPTVRVESTGLDWFSISLAWAEEAAALRPEDLARLRASREPFVRLRSGWARRETVEQTDALAMALADLGLEGVNGEQRVHLSALAQASDESLSTLARLGGAMEAVETLRAQLAAFKGLPACPPSRALVAELRPYQQRGLEFLAWASDVGLGAILADDMGLGKTVQALAWLQHLRDVDPSGGPSLVVCPASVVHNWVREAQRFTPGLRVLALTAGTERAALRDAAHEHDLLVTTYALLRRDIAFWSEQPLRVAILDEAQHIKNPATAVAKAARELKARHRLALTGTPMENRLLDLWSLVAFTNPGLLGTRGTFLARFDGPDVPAHTRRLLSAKLRPVLLRRLKSQVALELPPRIEERLDCELTPGQRKLYLAELERARQKIASANAEDPTQQKQRFEILAALTRLRQICCHPALAGGRAELGSGKFEALHELLEPLLAEGRKVLVFSQFVECLKLVQHELRERGVPYHMLVGSTTRREQVVSAFEEDARACVFLISLKAGGTGLNLTAASEVVLLDPWWNPAVEAQAIDRTHRIGQTRTVIAYRLIARGTVEDRIAELQDRKRALIRDVLGDDAFASALTPEDVKFLLAPDPALEG